MSRKIIELHNFDKYQPYFHAPLVDRIEGDSEEIVLSADGREHSASGNTVGSMSINVSGGMWIDHGPVTTQQFAVSGTASSNTHAMFSYDSNTYSACFFDLVVTSSSSNYAEQAILTFEGVSNFSRTGTNISQYGLSASSSGGVTTVNLTNSQNDTYKAVIRLL